MKNEHGLTQNQELFACAIVEGLSQADAVRRAYKASKGWKASTIYQEGARLAALPHIRARVKQLQDQVAEVSVLKAADVLEQTSRLVLFNPKSVYGQREDGTYYMKLLPEMTDREATGVKVFKIDDLARTEYAFHDKVAALGLAAKLLGMFKEDNKQKADGLAELLAGLNGNVLGAVPDAAVFEPGKGDEDDA